MGARRSGQNALVVEPCSSLLWRRSACNTALAQGREYLGVVAEADNLAPSKNTTHWPGVSRRTLQGDLLVSERRDELELPLASSPSPRCARRPARSGPTRATRGREAGRVVEGEACKAA
jgi:hypothetical protein